jgi:hypothetical protein
MAKRTLVRIICSGSRTELRCHVTYSPILGILPKLLSALRSAGIVTEDLSLSQDAPDNLEATYRGLCIRPTKMGQENRSLIRRRLGGWRHS